MDFKVEILKHPTDEDWMWCKTCTLNTVGKTSAKLPTAEWKHKILEAGHSPIRELWFGIKMQIPYFVSVHFVRHHIGVNHYVQTQRNDRQGNYDRTKATQDTIVSHVMSINAQELIFMSHKRLCSQASAPCPPNICPRGGSRVCSARRGSFRGSPCKAQSPWAE